MLIYPRPKQATPILQCTFVQLADFDDIVHQRCFLSRKTSYYFGLIPYTSTGIMGTKRKYATLSTWKTLGEKQQWRCAQCSSLLESTAQVDHVVPLHNTGSNHVDNLQILCVRCHARKTQDEMRQLKTLTRLASKAVQQEQVRLDTQMKQLQQDKADVQHVQEHIAKREALEAEFERRHGTDQPQPDRQVQDAVMVCIRRLNNLYQEHGGKSCAKRDRIHMAKELLRLALGDLAGTGNHFNFGNNHKIAWILDDGSTRVMVWKYLCRPSLPNDPRAGQFEGIIHRPHKHFMAD